MLANKGDYLIEFPKEKVVTPNYIQLIFFSFIEDILKYARSHYSKKKKKYLKTNNFGQIVDKFK